jgi:hypothetical protein
MGAIQDRTREHLATSDKVIMANRRLLLKAIEAVAAGEPAPGLGNPSLAAQRFGPDTVDGLAPTDRCEQWWREAVTAKRQAAPWPGATDVPPPEPPQQTAARMSTPTAASA